MVMTALLYFQMHYVLKIIDSVSDKSATFGFNQKRHSLRGQRERFVKKLESRGLLLLICTLQPSYTAAAFLFFYQTHFTPALQ